MPRPDNSTPLIDLLSANDSQNNPSFNSIILKTISGSIYQSRVGLYRTPTPFQIISRALSGWIVSAKEASAEQKYFESFFFIKSTQFAVDPAIIQSVFGSIWRDLYIIK